MTSAASGGIATKTEPGSEPHATPANSPADDVLIRRKARARDLIYLQIPLMWA